MPKHNSAKNDCKADLRDFDNQYMEYSNEVKKCLKNGYSVVIKANKNGDLTIYKQRWDKLNIPSAQ